MAYQYNQTAYMNGSPDGHDIRLISCSYIYACISVLVLTNISTMSNDVEYRLATVHHQYLCLSIGFNIHILDIVDSFFYKIVKLLHQTAQFKYPTISTNKEEFKM